MNSSNGWAASIGRHYRREFEAKISRVAYKTAELKSGSGIIGINDSYMQDGVAIFWGTLGGHHGMWTENELQNFVL